MKKIEILKDLKRGNRNRKEGGKREKHEVFCQLRLEESDLTIVIVKRGLLRQTTRTSLRGRMVTRVEFFVCNTPEHVCAPAYCTPQTYALNLNFYQIFRQRGNRYLVTNLDDPRDMDEFLQHVIVPFHQKLVEGRLVAYYRPSKADRILFGGLYEVCGDHPGLAGLMGKKNVGALRPQLRDSIDKSQISAYYSWSREEQDKVALTTPRVFPEIRKAILLQNIGRTTEVNRILNEFGLAKVVRTREFRVAAFSH